jgi:hypothetical protein
MMNCASCAAMFPSPDGIVSACGTQKYCSSECKDWVDQDDAVKQQGVELVVETLEFLAIYDELFCPLNLFVKLVSLRHALICSSRRLAKLWIMEAETFRHLVIHKSSIKHQKVVVRPNHVRSHLLEYGVEDIDTQAEETFVWDMLWEESSGTCLDRLFINRRLAEAFSSTMATPESRQQVFINAKANQLFSVAKGPYNQTVALTYVAAEAGLLLQPAPAASTTLSLAVRHVRDRRGSRTIGSDN